MENTNNTAAMDEVLTYDPAIVTDMDAFELIRDDAWMRGRVVKVTKEVCKTGTRRLKCTVAPLDEEGKAKRPTVPWYIYPVIRNAKTNQAPKSWGFYCVMRSLDPNFPKYARKLKTGGFQNAEGETIDKLEYDMINASVKDKLARTSVDVWNTPEQFRDEEFFFKAAHKTSKSDGKVYPEVSMTLCEEPTDGEVEYNEFLAVPF